MIEEWLPVNGYEGHYEVSNLGNVRVVKKQIQSKRGDGYVYNWAQKTLRPTKTGNGYLRVCLYKSGRKEYLGIHRLVAEAFIHNPENKTQVNHKNGVRDDNKVENLEWATPSENLKHKYRVLGCKPVTRKEKVVCVETGEVYESETMAAKMNGLSQGNIAHVLAGTAHTCGGFHWKKISI